MTNRGGTGAGLVQASRRLSAEVDHLRFDSPVAYVYNPLAYARSLHESYLLRYGGAPKQVLLLGMNPGPFGMAQTGIPFGDVTRVRDFLRLTGPVDRPTREHPKRLVLGMDCPRGEVSGTRLWGWAEEDFHTADRFFERFFVANYCPLVFMEESGRNVTPDKLPAKAQARLFSACDEALREVVAILRPTHVVGVGAFAMGRAKAALGAAGVAIGTMLHPSPASPAANRGWAAQARRQLREMLGDDFNR
jgi:single-strand selective monofunctional uracil DNA glycosylase